MNDYDNYEEWAEDLRSGYLYDPDGVQLEIDRSMSLKDFFADIDEKIEKASRMRNKNKKSIAIEKILSRLVQVRDRTCEDAMKRFIYMTELAEKDKL